MENLVFVEMFSYYYFSIVDKDLLFFKIKLFL